MSETIAEQAARLGVRIPESVTVDHSECGHRSVRPTRERIAEAADNLASEAWRLREVPGILERADEIRRLVREQYDNDVMAVTGRHMDRIGRQYVGHYDWTPLVTEDDDTIDLGTSPIWKARTPDQKALEVAVQSLIDTVLSGEQRVMVRWRYGAQYTEREIARMLGITQPSVHSRLQTIHRTLRSSLTIYGETYAEVRSFLVQVGQRALDEERRLNEAARRRTRY